MKFWTELLGFQVGVWPRTAAQTTDTTRCAAEAFPSIHACAQLVLWCTTYLCKPPTCSSSSSSSSSIGHLPKQNPVVHPSVTYLQVCECCINSDLHWCIPQGLIITNYLWLLILSSPEQTERRCWQIIQIYSFGKVRAFSWQVCSDVTENTPWPAFPILLSTFCQRWTFTVIKPIDAGEFL